ncbi:hypothetical protein MAUB1S_11446 [Mycolicibacterium aubagnense]
MNSEWKLDRLAYPFEVMMQWKPIAELTEEEFGEMKMRRRLMLWNPCNGPHHFSTVRDAEFAAWQLPRIWEKYLILPEVE